MNKVQFEKTKSLMINVLSDELMKRNQSKKSMIYKKLARNEKRVMYVNYKRYEV